jgi:D-alanyl-lipoteichoic acid acyltransferase DltB (MBOAT superfamily)
MIRDLHHLVGLLGYIILGRLIVRQLTGSARTLLFAGLNLGFFYWLFFHDEAVRSGPTFVAYLALVALQYVMLRAFALKEGWTPWVAFFTPILALVLVRYVPTSLYEAKYLPFGPAFVGISYMAFRCSLLVLEVRNRVVKPPGFLEYVGFSIFVPTTAVGPINPYSNHLRGFDPQPPAIPSDVAAMRVLVGMVKYKFLGSIFFQMTYANFLLDDHYHHWIDLPIAAVFYYLFLYCNFSGFCDMAIGCAGLIGIPVIENFDYPFAARNMRDFWNRWHISLSQYMRDVLFSPLSKFLAGIFGPRNINHAIAVTILIVFLLIGIWHGAGLNYMVYGLLQGCGVAATHYYTVFLKKKLGRDGFAAYNANRWIHAAAVVATFSYNAMTLFFFANTFEEMRKILSIMR